MTAITVTIDGRSVHPKVTREAVVDAVERRMTTLDNPGFCIVCGREAEGVEGDARKYECESCGRKGVYGADEILLHFAP